MIKRIAPFLYFLAVAACVVVCPGTEPDTCLTYEKSVTCNTCQSPEELETIRASLGPGRARMDVGDTSFVLRDERFQVWIHHRRQYWDLAYPLVLDSVVRAEQLSALEQSREFASSEVEAVRVGEVESENRTSQRATSWRFLVRQGNLGRHQEIELRTRRLEADREESFWRLVDAIADLSILESDWIHQLPAIEGVPARLVVDRGQEAATLVAMGRAEGRLGRLAPARRHLEEALAILDEIGNPWWQARAWSSYGEVLTASGEPAAAATVLRRAVQVFRAASDDVGEGDALLALARAERAEGRLATAHAYATAALDLLETVRADVDSLGLRTSFLSRHGDAFELTVDLAMELHRRDPSAGWAAGALEISERARARSLLDLLQESGAGLRRGVDAALLERQQELLERLNAKVDRRRRHLERGSARVDERAGVSGPLPLGSVRRLRRLALKALFDLCQARARLHTARFFRSATRFPEIVAALLHLIGSDRQGATFQRPCNNRL